MTHQPQGFNKFRQELMQRHVTDDENIDPVTPSIFIGSENLKSNIHNFPKIQYYV